MNPKTDLIPVRPNCHAMISDVGAKMIPYEKRLKEVRARLRSRSLGDIIKALEKVAPRRAGSRGINVKSAFYELNAAVAKGIGERLLYEMNLPPLEREEISGRRSGFFEVSHYIFDLNPELPEHFAQNLLNACIAAPTNLVLALSHSDSVAVLVQHHVANVSFDGCLKILPECNDTRAIYALKALRWCHCWKVAAPLVFDSLLSVEKAVAMAAYWTLAAKASRSELVALCTTRRLSVRPDLLRTGEVRNILSSLTGTLAKSWRVSKSD